MEGDPKFIIEKPSAVTHLANGMSSVEGTLHTHPDVTEDEIREAMAEVHGIDKSEIYLGRTPEEVARRAGAGTRAFFSSAKWRSSWDPKADPSLN